MVTKKQVNANRENAKKSTGPKTPEGKEKSSQNAIKHGLTACYNVIEIEDREEFDFFRHEMLDDLYPIGPMQYRLAERIVSLSWRLRRAEIMHDKTIDDLLQKDRDWLYYDVDNYRTHPDMPDNELALGHMAESDFSHNKILNKLMMYERRIENSMYKTMKQLKILKNEPISSSTTERKEPIYQPREVPEDNYEKLPISIPPEVEKIISRIRKNLNLDDIQDSTTENKESAIENPESTIENPESTIENPESTIENPESTIENQKMQNEPNLHEHMNDGGWQRLSEGQAMDPPHQQANNESRLMQNEPNYNHSRPQAVSTNNRSSIINNQ